MVVGKLMLILSNELATKPNSSTKFKSSCHSDPDGYRERNLSNRSPSLILFLHLAFSLIFQLFVSLIGRFPPSSG